MKWILKHPERFMLEVQELDSLEKYSDWFTYKLVLGSGDDFLEVHFNLTVHGRTYEGKMTYPEVFPNSPPRISPRNSDERWSNHQYGAGGSMCLQWRPDNWNPEVTGSELIRNVHELLNIENSPIESVIAPSAHSLTEGQVFRGSYFRTVFTNDFLLAIAKIPNHSRAEISSRSVLHTYIIVDFIIKLNPDSLNETTFKDLPPGINKGATVNSFVLKGWCFKSDHFDKSYKIETADDLVQLIKDAGLDSTGVLVKTAQDGEYERCTILISGSSPESIRYFTITKYNENSIQEHTILFPDDLKDRLPKNHTILGEVKIGIIGLGSIGSKICLSLARSGFKNFVLFDDDLLKPENLVRHELTWAETGLHKVFALKEKLQLIAPEIEVEIIEQKVGGQESPLIAAASLKTLSKCNLLLDATANAEVFLQLAAIADDYRIPMVWGEVFAGGYGGLIARARPDLDPNPISVRNSLHTYLSTLEPAPYKNVVNYDVDSEIPSIAYDSNVGLIASSMCNLIIDTALSRNPSHYPYAIYLIGMEKTWIFEQPFDIRPVEAQGKGWAVMRDSSTELTKEAVDLLVEKLKDPTDDKPDPASRN